MARTRRDRGVLGHAVRKLVAAAASAAAAALCVADAGAQDKMPPPLVSASAGIGPTFALGERPCGADESCRTVSFALALTGLVRVVPHLSLGASALYMPLGTVTPDLRTTAQDNALLHLDFVARYHFLPENRITPWVQIGAGLATVFAGCSDDGPAPCNADPTLSTSDSAHAFSARAGFGVDYRLFRWLHFGGGLEVVGDFGGERRDCGAGTCATFDGNHLMLVALFGGGVDAGKR